MRQQILNHFHYFWHDEISWKLVGFVYLSGKVLDRNKKILGAYIKKIK